MTYSKLLDTVCGMDEMDKAFMESIKPKPTLNFKEIMPDPARIIFHNPATIVFWRDGTKTVVKCMKDDKYDEYTGFCIAFAKKCFGSTSRIANIIKAEEEK